MWQQEQQQQPRPQQQQQPQQHPNSQKNKHMNNNNNKKTLVGCDTIEINLVVLQLLNSLKSLKFSTWFLFHCFSNREDKDKEVVFKSYVRN